MSHSGHPFWEFSLQLYARHGVAEASLALQERFDADINMLFFVLWAAESHRTMNVADIGELIALVQPWRDEVVRPLRAARRFLKTTTWKTSETDGLRKRIQEQELDAERLQQLFLETRLDPLAVCAAAGSDDCAAQNLKNYAASIDAEFPDEQVSVLLSALGARP
jgi:uncharacterized protein (TIGR02444 family)